MGKFQTFIKLINKTSDNITTKVSDIDDFDWVGDNRPDKKIDNLIVAPSDEITREIDINTTASSNLYTLEFLFKNGKKLRCRIDQGIAQKRSGLVDGLKDAFGHQERGVHIVSGDTDFYRAAIQPDGNYVNITVESVPV